MMAYFYLMFGVLFGIKIGKGNSDGSIVMFCRICSNYAAGDLLVMRDGELMEYGDNDNNKMVAGKVIASLRIRGFYYEDN